MSVIRKKRHGVPAWGYRDCEEWRVPLKKESKEMLRNEDVAGEAERQTLRAGANSTPSTSVLLGVGP